MTEPKNNIKKYLSLVKFSHTIFALPFALIGFSLALKELLALKPDNYYKPFVIRFLLMLACMVTARNAAMAFNRYLDRHFDALNPRTAIREIPKGIISPNNALRFTVINAILFITAAFFINKLCFFLSPIALFVILIYSYTKRFTALCHLVLGVGLSLAPVGAYLSLLPNFTLIPILFSCIVLCWVSGFDIIYALQDEGFDKQHQLKSIPAMLGKANALFVSRLLHCICASLVLVVGIYGHFNLTYFVGAFIFIAMLLVQQLLVKPNDLSKVNVAFMTANGIASVVFAIFVIADIFNVGI